MDGAEMGTKRKYSTGFISGVSRDNKSDSHIDSNDALEYIRGVKFVFHKIKKGEN